MALNKQIHIYSVDTSAFYNEEEQQIDKQISLYRNYKKALKDTKCKKFKTEHKKEYKKLYSDVIKKESEYKSQLKILLNSNKNKVREFNEKYLNDKNIISVFESTLTRVNNMKINELNEDILVVQTYFYEVIEQLIKNGFTLKGERYKYLTSSAGQIRLKKTVFIKESIWNKCEKTLMCGLTIDKINELGGINVNKFLAYLALSNSATDEWIDFDINKCIVVKDFETNVNSYVDHISDTTYEIERKIMDIPITHTDGCGMMLPKVSKKNFMVRLPWIKGLLASFDFVKFIKEHNCSPILTDIYGKQWDIIKDDIQIIFTESQFKMYKYYKDWNEYKQFFREFKCQAGICNIEEKYIPNATINYQMLQTLTDITEDEIEKLLANSKQILHDLSRSKETMLKVFGATKDKPNKSYLQQALCIYPELLQDEYCKHTLREIKNSLVKGYKAGKLEVNGKYTFLIPDLYAFCEWLFLGIEKPKGLLRNGEVYCELFKDYNKVDCLRSPHLAFEHAVRELVKYDECRKWFKTNAMYTSSHDVISKVLQFDVDGDKVLGVVDENIINVAERNRDIKDFVPLYYEMKKALPVELNNENIYNGLNSAFSGGNIGEISNAITKIWNKENVGKYELNIIKLLCMENNFIIDYAKTLYKPERPSHINKKISKLTRCKLPHFFIYAKDKKIKQVEKQVNSLVDSFNKRIKNPTILYNKDVFGELDYKMLMNNKKIEINEDVIAKYEELNRMYHFRLDNSGENDGNMEFILNSIKDELLKIHSNRIELTDMLIKYLFTKRTDRKKVLWKCFGDVIIKNLENNIKNTIMCFKCGKRFEPKGKNHSYCEECQSEREKELKKERNKRYYNKRKS